MQRLRDIPAFVALLMIGGAAMAVPAMFAMVNRDYVTARDFFYSGLLVLFLSVLLGIATAANRRDDTVRGQLLLLLGTYVVGAAVLALPLAEAGDLPFAAAWWEMISALTSTGASLFAPDDLAPALHLWRALVGWMGGYFMLVTAVAVLGPLNLGGFEVLTGAVTSGPGAGHGPPGIVLPPSRLRIGRVARTLLPAYGGLTLVLWVLLTIAGDSAFVAACHAMATLSTSGISPVGGLASSNAGLPGEILIAAFLVFALSRRLMPGDKALRAPGRLRRDPELLTAAVILGSLTTLLFLRHWIGAIEMRDAEDAPRFLSAIWGTLFTLLSFMTTTGFEARGWTSVRIWSGLDSPGLILMGLAIIGGGVATTAGGVHLLRIHALFRHGERETERLIHPHSVGGAGPLHRMMRRQGAQLAWVFFMLFSMSIGLCMLLLSLDGHSFAANAVFAIAALSTTGPLATLAADQPLDWSDLSGWSHMVLAGAMVVGRLETLAIIALLNPDFWRR